MNGKRTYVIAEAGVNHNGSLRIAKKMVAAAAEAGVDAIKFQTFVAESVIARHAAKANYQIKTTGKAESQLEMVKKLELDRTSHRVLLRHCRELGIQFLSTAFDQDSMKFLLEEIKMPTIKISSGEITNGPLLLTAARYKLPIILSTGMSTLHDIREALGVIAFGCVSRLNIKPSLSLFRNAFKSKYGQRLLKRRVSLMHCVTEYPAAYEAMNLRALDTLSHEFRLPIGLSDHSLGICIPMAAVAMGAEIVEKHFTLDRAMQGPDHRASLEPDELTAMVRGIRAVESALGSGQKKPTRTELVNKLLVRKSLVARKAIKRGALFSHENLTAKRPGRGISPMRYWEYLGRKATRHYQADDFIAHG